FVLFAVRGSARVNAAVFRGGRCRVQGGKQIVDGRADKRESIQSSEQGVVKGARARQERQAGLYRGKLTVDIAGRQDRLCRGKVGLYLRNPHEIELHAGIGQIERVGDLNGPAVGAGGRLLQEGLTGRGRNDQGIGAAAPVDGNAAGNANARVYL